MRASPKRKSWIRQVAVKGLIYLSTAAVLVGTAHAQIGTGGLTFWGDRVVKESIGSTAPVVQIASGYSFAYALRADGSVVAFGANNTLQCEVPKDLPGVKQISAGHNHALLLMKDGTVKALGWNNYFQLNVPAGLNNVVQIAAGTYFSVALRSDGSIVVWGDNQDGEYNVPANLTGVVQIAAGDGQIVALKSNGTVVCWGLNSHGEATTPAGLSGVVSIAAHYNHSGAVKSDGTIVCWGGNNGGVNSVPGTATGIVQLAFGYSHAVALKSDGTAINWGSNFYGETAMPSNAVGLKNVDANAATSYGLTTDGTIVGWGDTTFGETIAPLAFFNVAKLAVGWNHMLILRQDGTVGAWGNNVQGQCNVPNSPGTVYTDISAGAVHSALTASPISFLDVFGLNSDGQVNLSGSPAIFDHYWAFGYDTFVHKKAGGFAGFGDNYYHERELAGTDDFVQVTGSQFHALGLKADGTLMTAGATNYGLQNIPSGLNNVVQVSSGTLFNLVLKNDGTVASWGANYVGQSTPPSGLSSVVQVSSGNVHAVALRADGSIALWGDNSYNQLNAPAGLSGVAQIAAGQNFTVCLPKVSLSVAPYSVFGGDSATGTVFIPTPAPAGGAVVALTSSAAAATVPATVTVPAGQTSATFTVSAANILTAAQVVIAASYAGSNQESLLSIVPGALNMSIAPTAVVGGSTLKVNGTITLTTKAPVGGGVVTLSSSDACLTVPATVTVLGNQSTAGFSITHSRVTAPKVVTISAIYGGTTRLVNVTVNPFLLKTLTLLPATFLGSTSTVATATLNAIPASPVDVTITSSNTSVIPNPSTTLQIPANSTTGAITLTSNTVNIGTKVDLTATVDASSVVGQAKVLPMFVALKFGSGNTYGLCPVTCKLTLYSVAPAGGLVVNLTGDLFTVPTSVTVPAGTNSVTFTAVGADVPSAMQGSVTASVGSFQIVNYKNVLANMITAITITPATVKGSSATVVTVVVGVAGKVAVDTMVPIVSSDPAHASVPASVLILAGTNSGSVQVTHTAVVKAISIVITATSGGASKQKSFILTP